MRRSGSPRTVVALGCAPRSNRDATMPMWPDLLAAMRGVAPSNCREQHKPSDQGSMMPSSTSYVQQACYTPS